MCTKPSKFSTSAGLDRAEGSSTAGKARDASDFTDSWMMVFVRSPSPACSYTTLKIHIVPAEQDLLNRLLKHFAPGSATQDLGVVCGF